MTKNRSLLLAFWAMLLFVTVGFFAGNLSVQGILPEQLNFSCGIMNSLMFAVIATAKRKQPSKAVSLKAISVIPLLVFGGISNAIALGAIIAGASYAASNRLNFGIVLAVISLQSIPMTFIGKKIFKEPVTSRIWWSVVLAISASASLAFSGGELSTVAVGYGVVACLGFLACNTVVIIATNGGIKTEHVLISYGAISALCYWIYGLWAGVNIAVGFYGDSLPLVLALAFLDALANYFTVTAYSRTKTPGLVSAIIGLQGVFGSLAGWIFRGNFLGVFQILGIIAGVLAVILIEFFNVSGSNAPDS